MMSAPESMSWSSCGLRLVCTSCCHEVRARAAPESMSWFSCGILAAFAHAVLLSVPDSVSRVSCGILADSTHADMRSVPESMSWVSRRLATARRFFMIFWYPWKPRRRNCKTTPSSATRCEDNLPVSVAVQGTSPGPERLGCFVLGSTPACISAGCECRPAAGYGVQDSGSRVSSIMLLMCA